MEVKVKETRLADETYQDELINQLLKLKENDQLDDLVKTFKTILTSIGKDMTDDDMAKINEEFNWGRCDFDVIKFLTDEKYQNGVMKQYLQENNNFEDLVMLVRLGFSYVYNK